jgi:hypothetical protein
MDVWGERELGGGEFPDRRQKARLGRLLGDLGRRIGGHGPGRTATSDRTPTTDPSPRPSAVMRTWSSDPYTASAVTHFALNPAATARSIIRRARTIWVANATSPGTPASSHRSASPAQGVGRSSTRSMRARPFAVAYPRNTPI